MEASNQVGVELARVYVWEIPVRLTHWVIFFSILILSATGYYIGQPFGTFAGPAGQHFVMGTVRAVHLYTAIIFSLAVLVRVYWLFAGNQYARLLQFIPLTRKRWANLWDSALFFGFLTRRPLPYAGHDALAGAAYAFFMALYLILIATGLALYTAIAAQSSPFQIFGFLIPLFGGLEIARLIHHICMWLVLILAVVHIYSVFLWSMVEHAGEVDSIFSGYKFFPKHEIFPKREFFSKRKAHDS
jgi:Ni/Fe-hydrogenase 1 B-type cytochrome subunit